MKCVVSGATGFIGRTLCQQLVAQGDTVIALSKSGAPWASGRPTLAVDLAEQDPDLELLRGADVFIHLAGIAHQRARSTAYTALNYGASLRLAHLASTAGVRCFIFLSSVKAMGASLSSAVRTESECIPPVDAYGWSKWQAETALCQEFLDDQMSVAIVRPTLVYGAQAKGNLQWLASGVRWHLPRPPPGGKRSMIALEDLVDLLCVIAQRPPSGVQTWIACGAQSYSTREIYDLLREAGGKGRAAEWLPAWGWRLGAGLLDKVSGLSSGTTYGKLFGAELYSNAAVLADTDWRPRIKLEDVIGDIARAVSAD